MTGVAGFDPAGLARLEQALVGNVTRGVVAGVTALVARGDAVHVVAAGLRDLETAAPMRRDSLFRIASMTKPITSVAALQLVEAGVLAFDEPIERWLPEMADRRVLRRLDGPIDDTEPARRSITLRDLLTFRFGFGVVMARPGTYPIQQAVAAAGLQPGPDRPGLTPDQLAAAYGRLPLIHQPGERWMYNSASELLAVVVERAAGRPFDALLADRIFGPLGMVDTAYVVPSVSRDRIAGCYSAGPDGGFVPYPTADTSASGPRVGGATGLFSTVDDYLKFAAMLAAGGGNILKPETVAMMLSDQMTPGQKDASPFVPGFWDGRGWGFGLMVTTDPAAVIPRGYGWDGGLGTSWRTDPATGLTGILLTQCPMLAPKLPETAADFWSFAYRALA